MEPDISLGRWFAARAARSPNRRALTFEGATWTYAEMQVRIDRMAADLQAGGVCHGDRVAFLGLNQPAFFEAMFGAARLGAVFVPLNFRLTTPELAFIIEDAGVHTLVVDDAHRPLVEGVPVRRLMEAESDRSAVTPLASPDPVAPDEVAVIMYTSGTTGRPKGAMLTHANLWWNNVNALHAMDTMEDDVTLVVAPLFHIGGLNVTTLVAWQKGAEVVLHRSFDPGACLADIPRYGVTTMFGVPAMFLLISQHPDFEQADLTSLRLLVCGGAPVPEPLIKLYNGRGVPIHQGYGLTETAPMVSFLPPEWSLAKLGSAGLPTLLGDVRVVDLDNSPVPPGQTGEICTRGPNVMKGYWRRPEATAQAIDPEGWFHTGDAGYLDEDGFLFVSDRIKDMVISGGENVYPAEVESVLLEHPAISEVAVIGLPDERWGEAVTAVAALKPSATLTLDELRDFAARSLARYKLPSRLETVEVLPRNPAGKILKFELRERFDAG
ncbi:MAG TPA: long-chain fatty acid--CoA ligase [Acidimicrobiales bacterium]|nr:long-chain fatty acid--CoA ligase [Acidimicrobiales bacterium]